MVASGYRRMVPGPQTFTRRQRIRLGLVGCVIVWTVFIAWDLIAYQQGPDVGTLVLFLASCVIAVAVTSLMR